MHTPEAQPSEHKTGQSGKQLNFFEEWFTGSESNNYDARRFRNREAPRRWLQRPVPGFLGKRERDGVGILIRSLTKL